MGSRALLVAFSVLLATIGVATFVSGRRQLQAAAAVTKTCGPGEHTNAKPVSSSGRSETHPWTGVVVARDSVSLSSRIAGRVGMITVRIGDRVEAGTVVARIDDAQLRADLAVARAGVAATLATQNRTLAEQEAAAELLTHSQRLGDLSSGEERMKAAQHAKITTAAVTVARAQTGEQASRANQMAVALAETELKAPFDGVVAARLLEPGAVVSPGTPIVRLQRSNSLCIRFAVPPADMKSLAPGVRIRARTEATAVELNGEVEHVAPEIDVGARLVIVEAKFDQQGVAEVADGDLTHVGLL